MFDHDIVDTLESIEKDVVQRALNILTNSTLFEKQEARLLARLASGGAEKDEELLARIKTYRHNLANLQSLKSLGREIETEE